MSTQSPVDTSALPAPNPETRWTPPPPLRPVPVHYALDHLHPTRWRLGLIIGWAVLVGFFTWGGYSGIAAPILTTTLVSILLVDSRRLRPEQVLWAALAIACSAMTFVRADPSVWFLSAVGTAASLVALARIRLRRSFFDLSWPRAFATIGQLFMSAVLTIPWVAKATKRELRPASRAWHRMALRALLIAVPIVGLVWLLLASADAVFRTMFSLHLNVPVIIVSLIGCAFGLFVVVTLLGTGLVRDRAASATRRISLGVVEQFTTLVALCVLLAIFVAVQASVAFGNNLASLKAQGISVADYTRSGWFQMMVVVGINAIVLVVFRALAPEQVRTAHTSSWWMYRVIATLLIALNGALLFSAGHRLALYDTAFGLTLLRLACWFGAAWLAVVLLLLLAQAWDVAASRQWFIGATVLAGVLTCLAWGLVNPVRVVVTHNVSRADVDSNYLISLGTDAMAPLLTGPGVPPAIRADLREVWCSDPQPHNNIKHYNLAIASAQRAWITACSHQ